MKSHTYLVEQQFLGKVKLKPTLTVILYWHSCHRNTQQGYHACQLVSPLC